MPAPKSSGRLTVGGASIYYATFGDPQNPPVILLHGGLGTSDHWSNQIPALVEADLRPIAIDSRGQGRSTRTQEPASYAAMANDVLAIMDELQIDKAAFVGWSDGGEIALKIAIEHAERVEKLLVFGATYDSSGRKPRSSQGSPTFRAYTAKCRADYQRLSSTPTQFNALVDWMLPVWRMSSGITAEQLRAIPKRTLIVAADHDELTYPDRAEVMADMMPNATFAIVADASHFAPWQAPREFNAVLVDFLRR